MSLKELEAAYKSVCHEISSLELRKKDLAESIQKEKAKSYKSEKDCDHKKKSHDLRDKYYQTFICDGCGKSWYSSFV